MTTLNEKERRDFISQTIVIMEQNASQLTATGFDPANRLTQLKQI